MHRRWLPLLSLGALSGAFLVSGCGSTVACESCTGSGGSSGGTTCTLTTGELHGKVSLFAPSTDPNSEPGASALVELRQMPGDDPLLAEADAQGAFSVELPSGSWIVGGQSADGYCTASQPQTISLDACGSVQVEVVLDECVL